MSDDTLIEELIQPTKLITRKSELNGYGVFAAKDIKEGEILEEAVFSRLRYRIKELVADELRQICYTLPCGCDTCNYAGRHFVLSSGYINLYNTSDSMESRNVKFHWKADARVIQVIAVSDIKKGNEILHYYGDSYSSI